MKRVFSTVAALGLVAGMATAANALDFSVTGNYWAAGLYLSDAQGAGFSRLTDGDQVVDVNGVETELGDSLGSDVGSDAYFAHEFKILPKLVVNDKVTIFGDVRLIDTQIWGAQDDTPGQNATTTGGNNNGHGLDINKLYMDYLSPIGKVRVGRSPAGAWGHDFLNHTGPADRIMWWPGFVSAPWGIVTLYQKSREGDAGVSGSWTLGADTNLGQETSIVSTDADADLWLLGVTYDTAPIKFQIGYFFNDNAYVGDGNLAANAANPFDRAYHRLDGSANFVFGNYYANTELVYDFGDWQDFDNDNAGATDDVDVDAMGFLADVGGNFGPLRTGVMYFFASGNDQDDDDMEAIMTSTVGSLGKDFQPWYILTGSDSGMAVTDHQGARADMVAAGIHSLGIYADYQFDDRLSFHGALAGGWADEEDAVGEVLQDAGTGEYDGRDDSYGWEIDLGAAYKLLDNLTYSVHFAYLDTGDFFAAETNLLGVDGTDADAVADLVETEDTNNVYQLIHKLSLTF